HRTRGRPRPRRRARTSRHGSGRRPPDGRRGSRTSRGALRPHTERRNPPILVPRRMNSAPHIGYVCADRGIPVQGTKGGSTHVRELGNALVARGAAVTMLAARLTDDGPQGAVRAEVTEVAPDRFIRGLRARVRLVAPGLRGETIANEALGLVQNH